MFLQTEQTQMKFHLGLHCFESIDLQVSSPKKVENPNHFLFVYCIFTKITVHTPLSDHLKHRMWHFIWVYTVQKVLIYKFPVKRVENPNHFLFVYCLHTPLSDHLKHIQGAQWLSGRELDSRPTGCGFEPYRRHCIVSLSKTHLSLLSTGSTQEYRPDITEKMLTGTKRIKSNKLFMALVVLKEMVFIE